MLTDRILPPEEWHRLEGNLTGLMPPQDPARVAVFVVEDDGIIVGHALWLKVDHVECTWIAPSHRGKAAVARHGWRRLQALIRESGSRTMLVGADRPEMAALLQKRAMPIPAQEYVIWLEQ